MFAYVGLSQNLKDLKDVLQVRTLTEHADAVHRVAFSDDGVLVVSGSGDNSVRKLIFHDALID